MITVIIVVFNAEKYLRYSIESVLNQTYKNFEIIAVDDGSTDSTLEILNEYTHLSNFTLIKKNHNKNLGGNRNDAIRIAKGEIIAFIDGDDIWEIDKLEIQMTYLEKYDMICSNAVLINEKNEVISEKHSSDFDGDVDLGLAELLVDNYVVVSSVLMKKSAIVNSGYFEDGPDTRAEDYILWLSFLKNKGNVIKYVNRPILRYRIHDNNWSNATTTDWLRLLRRVIEIRSEYLTSDDNRIRNAARIGSTSIYLRLFRTNFRDNNIRDSKENLRNVLSLYDNKLSFKYIKYLLGYSYIWMLSLIKK